MTARILCKFTFQSKICKTIGITLDAADAGDVGQLAEVGDEGVDLGGVVDEQGDVAFEDAVVALYDEFVHVDVELLGDDLRHFVEQTHFVEPFDEDFHGEEHGASHAPLGCQDAVAAIGFQSGGNGTLQFVDDDVVLVVDKSHDGVARNGFAAFAEGVFRLNGGLGELQDFLAVEILVDDEFLDFLLFAVLRLASEGEEAFPPSAVGLFTQIVEVGIAQFDMLVADGSEEHFGAFHVVESAEFVDGGSVAHHVVLLEKVGQKVFAEFACLAVLLAQNGDDFGSGFRGGGDVEP